MGNRLPTNEPVNEFDLLRKKVRKRTRQQGQEALEALRRRQAAIGNLQSGAALKSQTKLQTQVDEQAQEAQEAIDIAEQQQKRQEQQIREQREFQSAEAQKQRDFSKGIFEREQGFKEKATERQLALTEKEFFENLKTNYFNSIQGFKNAGLTPVEIEEIGKQINDLEASFEFSRGGGIQVNPGSSGTNAAPAAPAAPAVENPIGNPDYQRAIGIIDTEYRPILQSGGPFGGANPNMDILLNRAKTIFKDNVADAVSKGYGGNAALRFGFEAVHRDVGEPNGIDFKKYIDAFR